jgi:uncharacterized protein with PQ loop repeat
MVNTGDCGSLDTGSIPVGRPKILMLKTSSRSLFRLQLLLMPHIAHYRRTTHKNLQALIIKNKWLRRMTFVLAVAAPLMTFPQIYEIWISKRSGGVSLLSWGFYVFSSIIWFLYAIKIKDKPLYISSGLWICANFLVVLGLILY